MYVWIKKIYVVCWLECQVMLAYILIVTKPLLTRVYVNTKC